MIGCAHRSPWWPPPDVRLTYALRHSPYFLLKAPLLRRHKVREDNAPAGPLSRLRKQIPPMIFQALLAMAPLRWALGNESINPFSCIVGQHVARHGFASKRIGFL